MSSSHQNNNHVQSPVPADFRAKCDQQFASNCEGKPYLTGVVAASIFLNSGLPKSMLSMIWELSDMNQDGRFNRDEFAHAMWLIELQNGQLSSPPNGSSLHPPSYSQAVMSSQEPLIQPHEPASSYSTISTPQLVDKEMKDPLICGGCESGLLPDDIAYYCGICPSEKVALCEECYTFGRQCFHHPQKVKLVAATKLPRQDKYDDFGSKLKCDGCKIKFQDGMFCWHCKRCFNPNFCLDCWRSKGKRCKHADQGKVQLRRVGGSGSAIMDVVEKVGAILGG